MCNKENKVQAVVNWAIKGVLIIWRPGIMPQVKAGELLRSSDQFKDQTYFIYNIKRRAVAAFTFPSGRDEKSAGARAGKKDRPANADKKESMGLCLSAAFA